MHGYLFCVCIPATLLLAAFDATAAPQDPARVDGSQAVDPAAVFAAPQDSSTRRHRRVHGSSDAGSRRGWIGPVLPQQSLSSQQDTLQQGVRNARDAMDAMGRQLLPALRNLKRDFDAGLERAAQD